MVNARRKAALPITDRSAAELELTPYRIMRIAQTAAESRGCVWDECGPHAKVLWCQATTAVMAALEAEAS